MRPNGTRQKAVAAGGPKILSESMCVVYHSETGNLIHLHHVVNLEGAKVPEAPEIERRAVELALSIGKGRDRATMKTLFLSPEELTRPGGHKVDLHTGKLIIIPEKTG
jgi:hypothetical protein